MGITMHSISHINNVIDLMYYDYTKMIDLLE